MKKIRVIWINSHDRDFRREECGTLTEAIECAKRHAQEGAWIEHIIPHKQESC